MFQKYPNKSGTTASFTYIFAGVQIISKRIDFQDNSSDYFLKVGIDWEQRKTLQKSTLLIKILLKWPEKNFFLYKP